MRLRRRIELFFRDDGVDVAQVRVGAGAFLADLARFEQQIAVGGVLEDRLFRRRVLRRVRRRRAAREVEADDAEERLVVMVARDFSVRERADEAVAAFAERAADEDEATMVVARHREHDVDHVRHDREREAGRLEELCDLDVRRRDVEEDRVAIFQQLQHFLRDPLFRRAVFRLALRDEMVVVRLDFERAAVCLFQPAVALEEREVLADAVLRHGEARAELLDIDGAELVDELDDGVLAFFWQHGTVPFRRRVDFLGFPSVQ